VRAAQVREVRVEPVDRSGFRGPLVRGLHLPRQPHRPRRVPGPQRGRRRIGREPGTPEGAQRLEHPEGGGLAPLAHHQRTLHQVGQCPGGSAHSRDRGRFHRSRERGELDEQRALLLVEQPVGPLDDFSQ
jgi:hypothetical protein